MCPSECRQKSPLSTVMRLLHCRALNSEDFKSGNGSVQNLLAFERIPLEHFWRDKIVCIEAAEDNLWSAGLFRCLAVGFNYFLWKTSVLEA